eukprot:scaffold1970_cov396-Prasinococcus_capsulatus_cf.AAC.3
MIIRRPRPPRTPPRLLTAEPPLPTVTGARACHGPPANERAPKAGPFRRVWGPFWGGGGRFDARETDLRGPAPAPRCHPRRERPKARCPLELLEPGGGGSGGKPLTLFWYRARFSSCRSSESTRSVRTSARRLLKLRHCASSPTPTVP